MIFPMMEALEKPTGCFGDVVLFLGVRIIVPIIGVIIVIASLLGSCRNYNPGDDWTCCVLVEA